MNKIKQIIRLQDRVDELIMQFSQEGEPGGFYGLRLVRECLQLAHEGFFCISPRKCVLRELGNQSNLRRDLDLG
jgi:hypothetical protein